jgi:hypothetical protein
LTPTVPPSNTPTSTATTRPSPMWSTGIGESFWRVYW